MNHEESFFADPRTWVAIAFVIFFVVFGRKLWAVVTGMLDKRAETIRAELAEAQRLRTEAEAMMQDAKARRDAAITDAVTLLENARREATRLAETAATDAEHVAKRREEMAMLRIAAAERAALDEVRVAAAEIATAAARAYITENVTADAGALLINRAIEQLPIALSPRRAA